MESLMYKYDYSCKKRYTTVISHYIYKNMHLTKITTELHCSSI